MAAATAVKRFHDLLAVSRRAEGLVYDFAVLGAGGGGCAAAASICAKYPDAKVVLLEAGHGNWEDDLFGRTLLGAPMLTPIAWHIMGSGTRLAARHAWYYTSTPQAHLGQRALHFRRGRGLGGHSNISDATYLRGSRIDYGPWAEPETPSWTADSIMRTFAQLRTSKVMWVERPSINAVNSPLNTAFGGVCDALELNATESLNVNNPLPQVAVHEMLTLRGRRLDSFTAHCTGHTRLDKAPDVQNLSVFTGSFALKANFASATAAVGLPVVASVDVVAAGDKGRPSTAAAADVVRISCRKLIVTMGAVETPAFLQRSGVGVRRKLDEAGIPCVAENPHVGEGVDCIPSLITTAFFSRHERSKSLVSYNLSHLREQWVEYKRSGRGIFASCFEYGALMHSVPGLDAADMRMDFFPFLVDPMTGGARVGSGLGVRLSLVRGVTSPGSISVRSADPSMPPCIALDVLRGDRRTMEEACAWAQMLVHPSLGILSENIENPLGYTHPFEPLLITMDNPKMPALDLKDRRRLVEQCYITDGGSITGSCALGKAVGDALELRGVQNVYVADGSVIPNRMNADPHVVARMVGTRLAEFV